MMKVLSIKQPWAWGIVHGPKRIENRSWGTGYRGPVLIHASGSERDAADPAVREWWRSVVIEQPEMPPADELVRGAVIGCANLVACSRWPKDLDKADRGGARKQTRFSEFGCTWWVLRDVVALARPVAVPGRLGLWDLPEDLVPRVREQMGGVA